jgi:hypothetical protein
MDVDWTWAVQGREQWRVVNAEMNLRAAERARNFTGWATISFSRRIAVFHMRLDNVSGLVMDRWSKSVSCKCRCN